MRSSPFPPQARPEAAVLCLAATIWPGGRANDLSGAVLARLDESVSGVGAVVLAPDGDIDTTCLRAICVLHERLRARGIQLRLVTTTQEQAKQLLTSAVNGTVTSLAVHPSLRSAVLAACAALPGPGLVNAGVRAALSAPVEQLRLVQGAGVSGSREGGGREDLAVRGDQADCGELA
jgi:hypothetical protein